MAHSPASVERRQRTFGYTEEELKVILTPIANQGAEPLGAMGSDTPIAVLSNRPRLLFDYFTQMFAQVTNPPLDAIREELVTSLGSAIGPEPNLLSDDPTHARKLVLDFPVVDNDQLAKIVHVARDPRLEGIFRSYTVRGLYAVTGGGAALYDRLEAIFAEVDDAIANGATHIILSDRDSNAELAPIPSLLLTSAVHHHLLRARTRTRISLVVEAGDVREVHHAALLIGYGAACVNPYLAMETVEDLAIRGYLEVGPEKAVANLIKALGKGVLKVMSKMGISTIMSYRGARSSRPWACPRSSWTTTSRVRRPGSGEWASTSSPPRSRRGTPRPTRRRATATRTSASPRVGSISGGATGKSTCSTRRRCSSSSTRRARDAWTCSASTPGASTSSRVGS